ncbi:hypothetical protein [Acinetobacter sp.]|uniref:hypothetical protein n=1 Tax=Acinetobacter sp. TaxID=472 RepID=UPI0038906964
MNNRIFSYSGEENWSDYSDPRDALQDMDDQGDLEVGNTFLTGIKSTPTVSQYIMDADDLLEDYDRRIDDDFGGDFVEGNTGSEYVTAEAKAELNAFLTAWAEKNLAAMFFEVNHEQEIELTQEMIDAFHANEPIPLPELKE